MNVEVSEVAPRQVHPDQNRVVVAHGGGEPNSRFGLVEALLLSEKNKPVSTGGGEPALHFLMVDTRRFTSNGYERTAFLKL